MLAYLVGFLSIRTLKKHGVLTPTTKLPISVQTFLLEEEILEIIHIRPYY